MWRFLLPAFFAMTVALILLFAGVRGDAQSAPGVSERVGDIVGNAAPSHASPPLPTPAPSPFAQGPTVSGVAERPQEARDARDDRATDLRHQVSDLQDLVAQVNQQLAQRKAQNPAAATGGQQGPPDAPQADDLQRQDGELHKELQGLITQLEQELQLEEQSPPVADVAEQQERQAARDALRHEIADLHREDNEVQGLMAHRGAAVAQREPNSPPSARTNGTPDAGQQQTAGDALDEHQAADLRSQIADLQRQDDALQHQIAAHKQELAERTHELDVARAEADNLRQGLDTLRRQRQAEEASLALDRLRQSFDTYRQQRQADDASGARRQTQEQQQAATAAAARTAASKPVPQPAQPVSTRQPGQPTPTTQPAQPMPAEQLQTAQQWLSAGRPDEARRVLVMVQTQVVFQPGTPDRPDAQVSNPMMTDVGDAIRWLDEGAGGQAMQSITRAIDDANPGGPAPVREGSGYSARTP
jgi:hypothetical protein